MKFIDLDYGFVIVGLSKIETDKRGGTNDRVLLCGMKRVQRYGGNQREKRDNKTKTTRKSSSTLNGP